MQVAQMPSTSAIEAVVFCVFAAITLPLMLSTTASRSGFRPADVDVLFPTPVNPRLVLLFRMVRDALITLLMPLLFAIFARPATIPLSTFVRNFPEAGQSITKTATVAWLLVALAWTTIGHGLALFINRSDEQSDRNKAILQWSAFLLVASTIGLVTWRLRNDFSFETVEELGHNPFLRIVFFPATLATLAIVSALQGNVVLMMAGMFGLVAVTVLGYLLALSQIDYMYDQAAAKGFDTVNVRSMQRSGDMYAVVAHQAKSGRKRDPLLRIAEWMARGIARWTVRGPWALLWKDLLLQCRGAIVVYVLMVPLLVLMVVLPTLGGSSQGSGTLSRAMLLIFLGFGVFMTTLQGTASGVIELLRRVDLQKPLPFSSTVTILWETVPKAVPSLFGSIIGGIVAACLAPGIWDVAIGGILMAPSLAIVLASVVMMVTILFPDVDDATQRSFRGLMVLLGSAIASAPMIVLVAIMMFAGINGYIIAFPAVALNLGIAVGISAVAGSLYAGFNPSE